MEKYGIKRTREVMEPRENSYRIKHPETIHRNDIWSAKQTENGLCYRPIVSTHINIYTYICIAWLFGRVQVDNSSSNNDVIWDTVLLVMSWSRTVNWPTVIAPLDDQDGPPFRLQLSFRSDYERTGGFADGSRFRTRLKRLMSKIRW